jgi:hypothetical protein
VVPLHVARVRNVLDYDGAVGVSAAGPGHQTTNLGVRSSNLFGRASNYKGLAAAHRAQISIKIGWG